jgi:D-glycero-alpha-D-manno-heptose-7-phosphate kinase
VPDTIVTRAPTRIDFGGGWTDVPPYCDELGGFVCNVAITRYATVTVTPLAEGVSSTDTSDGDRRIADAARRRFRMQDADVKVHSDFPLGAGLGGSSAVGVAMVAALSSAAGQRLNPSAMAELSREIEIDDLGIAGGRQDHYAAAYGGALGLRFSARGVHVRSIPLGPRVRTELEQRCSIVYTGQSRISGETIDAVITAYRNRDSQVLKSLERMREIAEQQADALAAGNVDALGRLVAEQWRYQRSLHPAIPTPEIDEIVAAATAAGALGVKALGASGGGCVLTIAGARREDAVRKAVASLGELISFKIDETGVERCL